jgi:hypothetical protein
MAAQHRATWPSVVHRGLGQPMSRAQRVAPTPGCAHGNGEACTACCHGMADNEPKAARTGVGLLHREAQGRAVHTPSNRRGFSSR